MALNMFLPYLGCYLLDRNSGVKLIRYAYLVIA